MSEVQSLGSTEELPLKLPGLRTEEEGGTLHVAVKCVDMQRKAGAKAALWSAPDAETREPGERTGLDTPVVLALNDVH